MSISIAQKYIDGMRKGLRADLSVVVAPTSGNIISFRLIDKNIVQGSFTLDRSVCSGDTLEIGSAMAAELNFTIKNEPFTDPDGKSVNPATTIFEGAQLTVNLTLRNSDDAETYTLPMGVFTVDEPPRKLSTINIKALDRMMRFDFAHNGALGTSLLAIVQSCCQSASVTLSDHAKSFLSGIKNGDDKGYTLPGELTDKENLTGRQVLMWVGEMTASCAYVDENGYLDFRQYPRNYTGAITIGEADRYSSDMQEKDITITGITVTPSEGDPKTIGEQGYEWNVEGNPLLVNPDEMDGMPLGYANNNFFSYRPFTATTKAFPHLWPLDAIVFSKNSAAYNSVVTHHTWKYNGNSSLSAVGKTATQNGYATHGGFTVKQKAVLERAVKENVKSSVSGYQQAILDINAVAQRASGLYKTTVTQENGTSMDYYHNQFNIADSTYIYMESTEGRFMATGVNAWNNGNPVWTNAWTSMGQIVANSIAAGSITTDMLSIGKGATVTKNNLFTNGDFYDYFSEWENKTSQGYESFEEVTVSNAVFLNVKAPPITADIARILRGSQTSGLPRLFCTQKIPVTAGQKYTGSFYIKFAENDDYREAKMCVDWIKSDGKTWADSSYVDAPKITGSDRRSTEWLRLSNTFVAPDEAVTAQIMFYLLDSNFPTDKQNYVYVTGFMLESGTMVSRWDDGRAVEKDPTNIILDENGIDVYNGAIRIYDAKGNLVMEQNQEGTFNFTGELTARFKNKSDTATSYLKITNEDYQSNDNATAAIKFLDGNKSLFAKIEAYKAEYTDTNGNQVFFPSVVISSVGDNSSVSLSANNTCSIGVDTTGVTLTGPVTLTDSINFFSSTSAIYVNYRSFLSTFSGTNCFYIGDSNWDLHSKAKKNFFDNDIEVDGVSFKNLVARVAALEK